MSGAADSTMLAWLRADPGRFDLVVAIVTVGSGTLLIAGAPENYDFGWPDVAAGVGAFVLLLLRRRWPFLLLQIAMVWTAAHIAIYNRPTPMIFAALVLLATTCVRLDRWHAIALGAAIAGSLYVLGLVSNDAELGDARAVIGVAWTAGAVGIADATRSWRRYKASAEAEIHSAVVAAEAQARRQATEERLTIARELHDLLAHNLSVMNVQTGAALHVLRSDPDQAEASLAAARDAGRTVLDELRDLLAVLRHDDADEPPTTSLPTVDEVPSLVDSMRSAGLAVSWTCTGSPQPLSPTVSLAAYRIIQEALTNAAKHGDGTAELTTEWINDGLTIRIVNVIAGEAAVAGGHGLIGMRERVLANGGHLQAESVGHRFVVDAWLPTAPDRQVTS